MAAGKYPFPNRGAFVTVLQKGDPVAGAVVEFAGGPGSWVTKTYTAAKGKGAFLNGKPISVSSCKDVNLSLLVLSLCLTPLHIIASCSEAVCKSNLCSFHTCMQVPWGW